ncbi:MULTISPECIES: Cd(II)/Pb(II)-responsive transcriptional regulator [Massilia]|uniref:Cd(II)/Pb(II)-responsive transcriptional regulator n=1 Tax=Massilia timonae TaxID=47229 RepID=A0A1S2N822_9BURK|nr:MULTISPECIES: Cd(II)/Pb(II)-responsive transcriptional regulator [Massilia]OIJ41195.1 Cd(II)/Pb(II)-responsive transcriptional regulator [Massilia timonae]
MKIGELAQRTGCLVETVRFYERVGLLPPPDRHANNYRSYGQEHADRLGFIRHCRALDMTLDEIRALLALRDHPQQSCADVNALIDRHIGDVTQRIAALTSLETQLRQLRSQCGGGAGGACAILDALSTS